MCKNILRFGLSLFLTCFIVLFSKPKAFSQTGKLILELSREQPVFPTDPEFAGLRKFVAYMSGAGLSMELQMKPLDQVQPALKRNARKGATLLIFPTVFNGYDQRDVGLLRKYVKRGGHLVWVAEHDNFFKHAEAINRFLADYGARIRDTSLKKAGTNAADAGWLDAFCPQKPEQKIRLYLPSCLEVRAVPGVTTDSLLVWPSPSGKPKHLLAARIHKAGEKGTVSVITDFEVFWNMAGKEGFSFGDNKKFLLQFLSGRTLQNRRPDAQKPRRAATGRYFLKTTQEDSLILRGLYGDLFKSGPWRRVHWNTGPQLASITTANLSDPDSAVGACRYCLCGPNTRFLQALAAHAGDLEKRYPGIHMAPRLKQLFDRLHLPSAPEDSIKGMPFLLSGPKLNHLKVAFSGFRDSVSYVGALVVPSYLSTDFSVKPPVFARRYAAPILAEAAALTDSSGLVSPDRLLVAGANGRHYFNGLGLWMANTTGKAPARTRRLKRSSWQAFKKWYALCHKTDD